MTCQLRIRGLVSSTTFLMAIAASAAAQEPLVHLPLDGSVHNLGAAGEAKLVVPEGADTPAFVEGRFGKALSFGKGGVVAIPYEFDQGDFPRATITMWVKVEADFSAERELFSLGPGNGLLLTISDKRKVFVRSNRQAMHDKAFPVGEWIFVSATVDMTTGTIGLQQNDDLKTVTGLDTRTPYSLTVAGPPDGEQQHYIFVGADDFNSAGRERRPVILDDVRLYPEVLDAAQIEAIRRGPVSASDEVPASPDVGVIDRERIGALPPTVSKPLPDTRIGDIKAEQPSSEIGETEKNIAAPPTIGTLPDRKLAIPDGLPGEEVLEDIEEATDALPPPEASDAILCKGEPDGRPVFSSAGGSFPAEFTAALKQAESCGERVTVAALNASGQWVVATRSEIAHSANLPADLVATLQTYESTYGGLDAADISDNGAWLIVSGQNYKQHNLPSRAESRLKQVLQTGGRAVGFEFAPGGTGKWALVDADGGITGENLPKAISNALEDMVSSKRKARQVRFGPAGEWAMLAEGQWFITENAHRITLQALRKEQERGKQTDHIVFSSSPGQYITYSTDEADRPSDPIYAVEHGFQATNGSGTTVSATIWERMKAHNLKAVSIAKLRGNQVEWARGYGLLNGDQPESYVYTDSTFDAASLSKPIAAFGLLQLVDEGKLSLTENGVMEDAKSLMSLGQRLEFEAVLDPSDGNLIQLLQHCAGICYRDTCAGGAAEYTVGSTLPPIEDMILGSGSAQESNRLRRVQPAGQMSDYTSANFMMVQALIDVHGDGFLSHMKPLLSQLDMVHSTFKSPYEQRKSGNYARGWERSAVPEIPAYGELAAASLVSTPTDYAKFMIALNKLAEGQTNDQLLSQDLVQKYLGRDASIYTSSEYGTCARPGRYALGIEHYTTLRTWGGGIEYYRHRGSHNGYRSRMDGFPVQKGGLVVFMTGDKPNADNFHAELRAAINAAYDLSKP